METLSFKTVLVENSKSGVWTLTINRPSALNALDTQVLNELSEVLRQIGEMTFEHARVLVIKGSGLKSFVAGADIKEISELTEESAEFFSQRGQSVFHELSLLKIPVIAAVNGFALGGGCELALGCDFIYASEKSQFGLPEVTLGLIPGFGGTVSLPQAVGLRRAREMVFTGELISAQQAYEFGLVNKVVSEEELMPTVDRVVSVLLKRAPGAIALAKRSMNESYDLGVDDGLKLESRYFSQLFHMEDVREGTQAFLEKRQPQFSGN